MVDMLVLISPTLYAAKSCMHVSGTREKVFEAVSQCSKRESAGTRHREFACGSFIRSNTLGSVSALRSDANLMPGKFEARAYAFSYAARSGRLQLCVDCMKDQRERLTGFWSFSLSCWRGSYGLSLNKAIVLADCRRTKNIADT